MSDIARAEQQYENLGPEARQLFLSLKDLVQKETGATCDQVPGSNAEEQATKAVSSYAELIRYGQVLLAVYRHIRRGIVPDPKLINILRERLTPEQIRSLHEQTVREIAPAEDLTRAQLAAQVLKDHSLRRLAVLPPDAAAQVNNAVRLEGLRQIQEVMIRKFLNSSLRTPDQIFRYLSQHEGVCHLNQLMGLERKIGDSFFDKKEEIPVKLKMIQSNVKRRSGMKRGNPIFFAMARLRRHRSFTSKLYLSQTARIREELTGKYRSYLEVKRSRRDNFKNVAKEAANRIANISLRRAAAAEREQKERLRALRERDMDSYMKLVKQTKNQRIHEILSHTEKLLQDIGARVQLDRTAQAKAQTEIKNAEAKAAARQDERLKSASKSRGDGAGEGVERDTKAVDEKDTEGKESVSLSGIVSSVETIESGLSKAEQSVAVVPKPVAEVAEVTEETSTAILDAKKPETYWSLADRVGEKVEQPTILSGGKLMAYQIAGLEFLVSLYTNNISGILADEMGLGKTIQTIGFLAYLKEKKNNHGPHLITVPLSTLPNWATEFEKWCPSLKLLQYRGNKNERRSLNLQIRKQKYDVLLTTFEYILREKKVLSSVRWRVVIVDEGHKMKNVKSKFHSTLGDFRSTHRLLLTGTPLQNNLNELWSLLNFLMPQTFSSSEDFERWFEEPFKDQLADTASKEDVSLTEEEKLVVINRLHLVLRPFLLRRVKSDVLSDLPSKQEYVIRVQLTKWQSLVYEQLVNKCLQIKDASGKITTKSVANVIMQLRKAVNHPYLFLNEYDINDDIWRVSGKFEILDRMLPKLLAFKHKTLIFCQMTAVMDIMAYYFDMKRIKYHRLDGSMALADRQERMDDFNSPDSDVHVFMLSTRAGGLGLNLQAADTVLIFDSDWNPHADLQAQARAHRVGQKSQVKVFRFVSVSPVEELILARAQHKLSIDEQIIQAGMFSNKFDEGERELKLRTLLSQKNDAAKVRVTTPQELIRYMARSAEEEEAFSAMDQKMFGSEIYQELFDHDFALDDSEGAVPTSSASEVATESVNADSVNKADGSVSGEDSQADVSGSEADSNLSVPKLKSKSETKRLGAGNAQDERRGSRRSTRSQTEQQKKEENESTEAAEETGAEMEGRESTLGSSPNKISPFKKTPPTKQEIKRADRESARIEELLIAAGRFVSEAEIPDDIVLSKPTNEESQAFIVGQELGARRNRFRERLTQLMDAGKDGDEEFSASSDASSVNDDGGADGDEGEEEEDGEEATRQRNDDESRRKERGQRNRSRSNLKKGLKKKDETAGVLKAAETNETETAKSGRRTPNRLPSRQKKTNEESLIEAVEEQTKNNSAGGPRSQRGIKNSSEKIEKEKQAASVEAVTDKEEEQGKEESTAEREEKKRRGEDMSSRSKRLKIKSPVKTSTPVKATKK